MKNKYISIEEFISDLMRVPYGIKYLDYVKKNQIPLEEVGENHHIYMVAICGRNCHTYHLSYFGHTMAHIYLAKAGLEGNYWWKYKALQTLTEFTRRQIKTLTDIEKIELEANHYSELRKLALTISGKHLAEANREYWKNISNEERKQRGKIASESVSKVWENRTIEERKKVGNNISKALTGKKRTEDSINNQKNTWLNKTEEEKNIARKAWGEGVKRGWEKKSEEEILEWKNNISKGWQNRTEEQKKETSKRKHEAYLKMSVEVKSEKYRKTAEGVHNSWISKTEDEKKEFGNKISKTQKGSLWMTNDGITVKYVIPRKQPEFISNGWYHCHRNGTPWEEKVA